MNNFPFRTRRELLDQFEKIVPIKFHTTQRHLGGTITRLSPYLTIGVITVEDLLVSLLSRYPFHQCDYLIKELFWREYFMQVLFFEGEKILDDLEEDATGIPKTKILPESLVGGSFKNFEPWLKNIVQHMYAVGHLHKHARMWLASYLVHSCKLHWRKLADWTYYYQLDGDIAINCLSWQWIAETFGSSPYYFTSENLSPYCGFISEDFSGDFELELKKIVNLSRGNPFLSDSDSRHMLQSDLSKFASCLSLEGNLVLVLTPWSLNGELIHSVKWDAIYLVLDEVFFAKFPWGKQRIEFIELYAKEFGANIIRGSFSDLISDFSGQLLAVQETFQPVYYEAIQRAAKKGNIRVLKQKTIHPNFRKKLYKQYYDYFSSMNWEVFTREKANSISTRKI